MNSATYTFLLVCIVQTKLYQSSLRSISLSRQRCIVSGFTRPSIILNWLSFLNEMRNITSSPRRFRGKALLWVLFTAFVFQIDINSSVVSQVFGFIQLSIFRSNQWYVALLLHQNTTGFPDIFFKCNKSASIELMSWLLLNKGKRARRFPENDAQNFLFIAFSLSLVKICRFPGLLLLSIMLWLFLFQWRFLFQVHGTTVCMDCGSAEFHGSYHYRYHTFPI